jgi:hypothetical protein
MSVIDNEFASLRSCREVVPGSVLLFPAGGLSARIRMPWRKMTKPGFAYQSSDAAAAPLTAGRGADCSWS